MHRNFSKAFSFWKSKASGRGRNKGCREPKERSRIKSFNGYPRDLLTGLSQKKIINALRLGNRGTASGLLSRLGHNGHLRADDFVEILKYCASSPDPLFVMETWRVMEEKRIGMNDKCHFLVIQALCKGGYIEEAFKFMSICRDSPDLYSTLPVFNSLLRACARMKSVSHADKCLDLMKHHMMGKNESTYTELLKLAVLQKNLSVVHSIWKEYARYYTYNLLSLRKFIWAFATLGDLKTACEALQLQVALVCRRGFFIARTADKKLSDAKLDVPIPFNSYLDSDPSLHGKTISTQTHSMDQFTVTGSDMEKVGSVGPLLHKCKYIPDLKVLRWSFTDIIHACVQIQDDKLAEQLFLQMQSLGVEPSCGTYDGLIRVLVHERGSHYGIEMLKIMQQKNLKPHDSTIATISVSCSQSLELDLAEAFLDQISKCSSAYPYNALLKACDTLDQPERAVRIFGKMKKLKLKPDIRTYELLFSLFGNVNAPYEEGNMLSQKDAAERIKAIEEDMLRNGIRHSYISINNLLRALGTEGMIKELIQYLTVAENLFARSNFSIEASIYNTVLQSLVEAKESQMAVDIFKTMMSCGDQPNAATYNIMIDCCCITGSFKSACGLVAMMIRHGYPPQMPTYTVLIKIVLVSDDFGEALMLLNQACSEEVRPDVQLFNTVLRAACEKDRIDIIEFVMERMHQEKVVPDSSTCGHVFSAYVNSGYLSTAMAALQVMSIHMISEEDINEKRTTFENDFIYAEDSEAESRVLDLFKESKENLAVALLNLRWCAMVGNPISWSTSQSPWMKMLSATYNSRRHGG